MAASAIGTTPANSIVAPRGKSAPAFIANARKLNPVTTAAQLPTTPTISRAYGTGPSGPDDRRKPARRP